MRHCFRKWLIALVILAWNSGLPGPVHAEDTDKIDLNEISRRLAEWRGSFVNVHATWEIRSLPGTDEPVGEWSAPPDPESASLVGREEWIWADHGLDLHEIWAFLYPEGGSEFHNRDVFNGPKGIVFQASFQQPRQGAEAFTRLALRKVGTEKPQSAKVRLPVHGLFWPGLGAWLPEILSEWKWKPEEIENISGDPCARISAEWPKIPGFFEILWLDLNHDCLVRRQRSPATKEGRPGRDFIIDEFQRLEGGIWFPKRGRFQAGGKPNSNQLFVVTEAAVNQSLDMARFEPPAPAAGTRVDDHGRVYTHGAPAAPEGDGASLTKSNTNETPGGPSATPPTSSP